MTSLPLLLWCLYPSTMTSLPLSLTPSLTPLRCHHYPLYIDVCNAFIDHICHAHMFIYECLQYCVMRACLYMMYVCNIASCAHVYIWLLAILRHAHMFIYDCLQYCVMRTCLYMMYVCNIASCAHVYIWCMFAILPIVHFLTFLITLSMILSMTFRIH